MKRAAVLAVLTVGMALFSVAKGPHAAAGNEQPAPASRGFMFGAVTHVPALPAGSHHLKIWVPLPYEESFQSISLLRIESAAPYKIEHEKEYGNRYAYITVDADDGRAPFDIKVTFHAVRLEHRVALTPSSSPASKPELSPTRFLQPDHLVPISGVIAELSAQQTAGVNEPLEKARKIYDYVVSTMHYDHEGTGWGRGDAIWACDSKHGNCTDFHSVFIGMARAAGIPARFEIGFSLPANSHNGTIGGYHCWSQFYIDGIGWIPIDASEASKNKDKKDYFFGATDQNRVMFSLGRDIHLKPAQKGEALNYFVYPYAELDGKPFDGLKNEYSFRDDPVPPAPTVKASTAD